MAARVASVTVIPNTSSGMLDYLVQRTDDTVGALLERSQAVVVGRVEDTRAEAGSMKASGEVQSRPTIGLQITDVQVERWLVGAGEAEQLEIVYPRLTGTGGHLSPLFDAGSRGLLFLSELPADTPRAAAAGKPAYRLAPGEQGLRAFQVTDYDDQGQPFTRDEAAAVEAAIAAVEWYRDLPHDRPRLLSQALRQALDSPNPRIARAALRALAQGGGPAAERALTERLPRAAEHERVRLMLGLWLLGRRQAAEGVLEELFRKHGRDAWLAGWGLQTTQTEAGEPADTLYGPDPSETRGD